MNATRRRTALASGLACAGLIAAGCSSSPTASTGQAAAPAAPLLATSFAAAAGAGWAVVQMGGPAAQHNNFWQLFVRQAGTTRWRLATPPGVADNGGLVVAGDGGGSMMTGFRPSQDLTFSPLAASSNGGTSWSPAGPLTPGLAAAPDALAATPAGQVIALTKGGGVVFGSKSGTAWTHLASAKTVAATPAGKACGLTGLTAAAFSRAGVPMLAASCSHPGTVGIFGDTGSGWFPAGPARPPALAREDIAVVRLAAAGPGVTALLRAGSGKDTSLIAAWSRGIDSPWALSAPLHVGARQLSSTAIGPGGSIGVTLNAAHGEILAGPGASWRALPALPRWAATLALGPGGQADAITAHVGTFSDYRLTPGSSGSSPGGSGPGRWTLAQTIKVPIQYGSSG